MSDTEKLNILIGVCKEIQDIFDAALTCPDDAGYRADAWDALEQLEKTLLEVT